MNRYDRDDIILMLNDLIAEHGNDKQTECFYYTPFSDFEPMCIVGHLFEKLSMRHWLINPQTAVENRNIDIIIGERNGSDAYFTPAATTLLREVQAYQDNHMSWGQAFDEALMETDVCNQTHSCECHACQRAVDMYTEYAIEHHKIGE